MPQLNPGPWLAILVMSWFIYLLILMPKTNNFKYNNDPNMQNVKKMKPQSWNWPWT
uniref:ATP synthase complex subunit 8 n=1 Tax=Ambystoma barbouri TaxID=238860 RepID=E2DP78_9SALA|nr:ATP synthase F0 subunit 8 [Ambystoma barbouri]ACY06208.1 ATP synthase F0 subunit 8 [Ambystoma barbouri]